jgi:hypothetical protein
MLIYCDRQATMKARPLRPKAGDNLGIMRHGYLEVLRGCASSIIIALPFKR